MNIAIASWPDTAPTFGNQHPQPTGRLGQLLALTAGDSQDQLG